MGVPAGRGGAREVVLRGLKGVFGTNGISEDEMSKPPQKRPSSYFGTGLMGT